MTRAATTAKLQTNLERNHDLNPAQTMDYSAISQQDPGTSTWASPGPERTGFAESSNPSEIESPVPPQQQSPYDAATTQPWMSSGDENPETPELSGQGEQSDDIVGQGPYATQQQQPPPPPQLQQVPARYQTPARQNDKQPAAIYKIQAKITGLERTGKKDPILRFDVHVGVPLPPVELPAVCWIID